MNKRYNSIIHGYTKSAPKRVKAKQAKQLARQTSLPLGGRSVSGDSSERDFLTGISRLDPKSFVFYSLGYSKSRNSSYWFCATWVEGTRFSSLWVDFRDEDNSSRRPGPMGTALFLAQSLHRLDIAGSQRGQQTGGRACSHQRDGHACEGLDVEGLHAVQQRSQQVGEARR